MIETFTHFFWPVAPGCRSSHPLLVSARPVGRPMTVGSAVLSMASLWYLERELFSAKPVLVVTIILLDSITALVAWY